MFRRPLRTLAAALLCLGAAAVTSASAGPGAWTETFPDTTGLRALAVKDARAAAVGDAGRVFSSADRGATWTPQPALTGNVVAATFDAAAPARLHVLEEGAGDRISSDDGATFAAADAGGLTAPVTGLSALATAPGDASRRYLGRLAGVVASWDEAGGTWTEHTLPVTAAAVSALAVDPTAAGTVYAATGGAVYRSTDGGANWDGSPLGGALPAAVRALAIDAASPGTLYAATADGIWQSAAGAAWAQIGLDNKDVAALVAVPRLPGRLFAATPDGVFRSSNWTTPMPGSPANAVALAIDGTPIALHAATSTVVYDYALAADLRLAIAAPATALTGAPLTAGFTLTNDGPDVATAATLQLDSPIAVTASTTAGSCTVATTVTCQLGTLAPGASATVSLTGIPTAAGQLLLRGSAVAEQGDPVGFNDDGVTATVQIAATPTPQPPPPPPTRPDTRAPRAFMGHAGLSKRFQTTRTFVVEWDAVDAEGDVRDFEVRQRSAGASSRFGGFKLWKRGTKAIRASFTGSRGRTYCFSARARDAAGNRSRWSAERCTAVPLDEDGLLRRAGWKRVGLPGGYLGRALQTRDEGARLVLQRAVVKRLLLFATRCPSCGTLEVRFNDRLLQRIRLTSSRTVRSQRFPLPALAKVTRGTLELRTVGSRLVRVDGLGISQATDPR